MVQQGIASAKVARNHPLAMRMGAIAGVSHNVVIGTVMGHFGVMLASAEQRMGISAEQVSLGIPMVLVGSSLVAPFAGVLIARYSLRLIMTFGALLTVAGFLLLGLTNSFPLYLIAYGLCLGPALSLTGTVTPATLVTRWFVNNRGLALGLVHLPLLIAVLPVPLNWFIEQYGSSAGYLAMATIAGILVPLTMFAIDHPPGGETPAPEAESLRTADGSFTVMQLLARPRFWAICIAAIASMASSTLLASLMVPIGVSWGFSRTQSAFIQSIMAAVAVAGSILFGWVTDRIGGARTLAVVAFDSMILWLLLTLQPSFAWAALVVGLIGLHGAGVIPGLSRALADTFGQASFSRGYGLSTMISLPFVAFAIVGSAGVYGATGSYSPALYAMAAYFAVALVLALYGAAEPKSAAGSKAG